jgi:hypothetical protein
VSAIYGFYWKKNLLGLGLSSLIGQLPVGGPGNYYISILIEFTIIAPIIYLFYVKSEKITIVSLCIINIAFELIAPSIGLFDTNEYLYSASIPRYFAALAFGMLIARELLKDNHVKIINKRNIAFIALLPVSIVYLFISSFIQQAFPFFRATWGWQNIISFPYSFLLIMLLLNIDYERHIKAKVSKIHNIILKIGKASYHIFLVQILFFGFNLSLARFVAIDGLLPGLFIIAGNLICTITLGMLFYYFETSLMQFLKKKLNSMHKAKNYPSVNLT